MRKLKNAELNRLTTTEFRTSDKTPLLVVLDNVRSLNNIGSIFRTSDAFLIEAIWLCGITAVPPHKDIHKTALGATESIVWKYFSETTDAVNELKGMNYEVFAIEQTAGSISLQDFEPKHNTKIAIIFGNEVKGVQQEVVNLCDGAIEIPQFGTKHSFNIAVSAGMVLWEIFRKITWHK